MLRRARRAPRRPARLPDSRGRWRLRKLQRVERKRLAGNRKIDARSCRDQDEHPGIGTALVQLPGRMQVTRSIGEHRRRARAIADCMTKGLELASELRIRTNICEH